MLKRQRQADTGNTHVNVFVVNKRLANIEKRVSLNKYRCEGAQWQQMNNL